MCFWLIDSEAVEASLVKGYSSKQDLCLIIEIIWGLALERKINFFIDRISSDLNPAGRLSIRESVGWQTLKYPGRKGLGPALFQGLLWI